MFLATRVLLTIVVVAAVAASAAGVSAGALGRDHQPVVLTGAEVPGLDGLDPSRIVAFKYEAGWVQVPVQVDERAEVDFGQIYDSDPIGATLLAYSDPGTFTGADPVAGLDGDDEIALRGRDAADRWPGVGLPANVIPGTLQELRIDDLLDGAVAWLYLFESDGSLDPAAGVASVDYDFVLLSGDYKSTYDTNNGPNPEDSSVTTGSYTVHFADRWIRDATGVTAGAATGVDVLDRHKNLFGPGNCARSENTFSNGEGAFIVNRSGPVRALRGYLGANSGPTTWRQHRFYEAWEEIVTGLRVHAIPGIMDFFDYEPAATGMRYSNDANPAGVVIDGLPDNVVPADLEWEMVTGTQGTLAHAWTHDTDIPGFDLTAYHSDDTTPSVTQCTGDAFEYGASGVWEDEGVPNTDPTSSPGDVFRLISTRTIRYAGPDRDAAFAARHRDETFSPPAVTVNPDSNCPDADADGYAVCSEGCAPAPGKLCGDCDDLDPSVRPGVAELCDGVDNDCDAGTADGADEPWLGEACDGLDSDLCDEGASVCSGGVRACDDATGDDLELCANLLDDDCDGFTDADDADCGQAEASEIDSLGTEGRVGGGENVLIGGFIVEGPDPKSVLVRVLGPSLADRGFATPLTDPRIELYDGNRRLMMQNDDWSRGDQAGDISASGLAPSRDEEPALMATLAAGEYTAVVHGPAGASGQAVVEIHEIDPAEDATLVNVSTRGRVRGVAEELHGSFVVEGASQKRVMIRALGPTLAGFGVSAALGDPTLELRRDGVTVATNDDWGSSPDAAEIDASGFAPPDALESAILIDLQPGTYDVIVHGADGSTGIGLLEVYDLDAQVAPLELRRPPHRVHPRPRLSAPEAAGERSPTRRSTARRPR